MKTGKIVEFPKPAEPIRPIRWRIEIEPDMEKTISVSLRNGCLTVTQPAMTSMDKLVAVLKEAADYYSEIASGAGLLPVSCPAP